MVNNLYLWFASGGEFGSGHKERMWELHHILKKENWNIHSIDLSDHVNSRTGRLNSVDKKQLLGYLDSEIKANWSMHIVDLRDINPALWDFSKKSLFLDNQNELRHALVANNKCLFFYDTIPHPNINFQNSLENIWFSKNLIDVYQQKIQKKNMAIFYSGSLLGSELKNHFDFFLYYCKKEKIKLKAQVGTHFLSNEVEHFSRLNQKDYLTLLAQSRFFFTYYGLSLFESLKLNTQTALYQISSVEHNLLSEFISKNLKIPYIRNNDHSWKIFIEKINAYKFVLEIGNKGREQLIQKINEIFIDKRT